MLKKTRTAKRKAKSTKRKQITKDILIGDLLKKYPESSEVLMKYGFRCIGCVMSPYETLSAGAKIHGLPVEPILKDINQIIKKSKNKKRR